MKNTYNVTYDTKDDNVESNKYGFIVTKTKKFSTFIEAVAYSRLLANNSVLIGKPVIEGVK